MSDLSVLVVYSCILHFAFAYIQFLLFGLVPKIFLSVPPIFSALSRCSLGGMLGFTIMMATDLQNRMNAVERVLEYSTKIPQEPPWQVPEVDDALPAGMNIRLLYHA